MRYLLIGYLALVAIVAVLGAGVAISALPNALEEVAREPEDYYGLILWAAVCGVVFAYCVAGVIRGIRKRAKSVGPVGYVGSLVVFLLGALVLVVAILSPLDGFLVIPAILVILCPVAYFLLDADVSVDASNALRQ